MKHWSQLHKHEPLLARLSFKTADGISDDEHEPDRISTGTVRQPEYKIRMPWWRSSELTDWLRSLDVLHIASRFSASGHPLPGNWPRIRYDSSPTMFEYRTKTAIPGLPRNCYNPDFLAQLSDFHIEQLEIKDVDYNFVMPAMLQGYDLVSFKYYANVDNHFI